MERNVLVNLHQADGEVDAAEIDRETIASRLRQDVVRSLILFLLPEWLNLLYHSSIILGNCICLLRTQSVGQMPCCTTSHIPCSTIVSQPSKATQHPFVRLKGHRFSITSAVVSDDGRTLFTAGKEGSIIGWNLLNGNRLVVFPKV